MIVGVLTVDLAIYDARTLKEKRSVILSLKDRLRGRFNVAVSEVAFGDSPKRCRLGIATVGHASRGIHSQLDQVVDVIRRSLGLTLLEYECETF